MKYFLDTEFLEDGQTIELMSIGVVAEDGREYYAVNEYMPLDRIIENQWLVDNVVPQLPIAYNGETYQLEFKAGDPTIRTPKQIKDDLLAFVTGDDIEFWAYYGDYDWVATCRLFGRMIDLPKPWPKFCYDLRQWLNHKGRPQIRQPDDAPHNALLDARWGAHCYKVNVVVGGDLPDHQWEGKYKKLFQEFNQTQYDQQQRISVLEAIIEAEDIRTDS